MLQLLYSDRLRDIGVNSDNPASGYQRVLAAPGVEYDVGKIKLCTDVEFPIYQDVNGDQLVTPRLYKLIVSYRF